MCSSTQIPGVSSRSAPAAVRAIGRLVIALAMGAAGLRSTFAAAAADAPATGAVEGRVSNAASGNYLNNAVVAIRGTNLATATNSIGEYRLANVPAGPVQIAVTFSGMSPQAVSAVVTVGKVLQQDFALGLAELGVASDVIQLEKYTVSARVLSGQAVAEQEQRNAVNIKSVVSIDQFGDMGEGNVGEFLKYVPGISLVYDPQRPQSVSIRGMPATGTIVMLNGSEMASTQAGTRTFDLGVSASGNVDRLEVSKVPTAEMPANAVGGTINIISKSGFSRRKPLFSYNAFLTGSAVGGLGDLDYSFNQRKGVDPDTSVAPNRPALNLSYILPLNQKLAFTFALSHSSRSSEMEFYFDIWDQVRLVQTYNRPSVVIFDENRNLAAMTVDWKIGDKHVLQASFQGTNSDIYTRQFQSIVQTGAGATGSAQFSQGAATGVGSAQQAVPWTTQYRSLRHGALNYRYEGESWKIDANATWSHGGYKRRDVEDGFFNTITTTLANLIVRYDGIDGFAQRKAALVTATDRTGRPVDIREGNNFSVTAANASPLTSKDVNQRLGLNFRRDFNLSLPFSLKFGALVSRVTKDVSGGAYGYAFNPPGGVAAQVAGNYDLVADGFSSSHHFTTTGGAPVTTRWLSPYKMYSLYLAHPEYFTFGTAQQANAYTSQVNTSKFLQETIPAAYVRGDARFLNQRLRLSVGVRFEQTQDAGKGPLNNVGAGYQKNASGGFLRDSAGRLIPVSTDALATAKLRLTERGARASRTYEGFFPSFNSSFEITPNVLLRAAYAKTIGRPNLTEIIPGITITDPDSPAATKTITAINTALTPWTSDNYDVTLEAYSVKGATASVSLFRKDIKNFFGTVRTPATADLLAQFGLTDDYLNYEVITKRNFGEASIQGAEFSYRQSLAPLVPEWAKGFEVFGNATTLSIGGANATDFTGFSPHEMSWGVGYARAQVSAKVNVQRSGWIRGSRVAASAVVPADTYNYVDPQTRVDVSLEYRWSKRFSLYGSVRNLTHTAKVQSVRGPGIPDYATVSYFQYTGALVTFGLKGDF